MNESRTYAVISEQSRVEVLIESGVQTHNWIVKFPFTARAALFTHSRLNFFHELIAHIHRTHF
jgi:hypothetical protein